MFLDLNPRINSVIGLRCGLYDLLIHVWPAALIPHKVWFSRAFRIYAPSPESGWVDADGGVLGTSNVDFLVLTSIQCDIRGPHVLSLVRARGWNEKLSIYMMSSKIL